MPKSIPAKRTSQRARTFSGCSTCRRRHVKCDQIQPRCLTCQNMGIECGGFVPDLRWVASEQKNANDGDPITRRHLYSERTRERMSVSVREGLTDGSVDASLEELDNRARSAVGLAGQAEGYSAGPFGFFDPRLPPKSTQQYGEPPRMPHVTLAEDTIPSGPIPLDIPLVAEWDSVNSVMSMDDVLQWDDIFGLDLDILSDPPNNMLDPLLAFSHPSNDQPILASQVPTWDLPLATHQGTVIPLPRPVLSAPDILELAPTLLKHFKKHVIQHISALPITSKSPWEIVNLASAVETYAQLTFLETEFITNAKRAGLYGLLSLSANHLARNPTFDPDLDRQDGYWDNVAQLCKAEATHRLQRSFAEEMRGPNKAKYKDQLIATLNLLGVSVNTGAQKDARFLMVDAERLMRLRGLAKREVSRKSRLLHHMYTWVRIVCESTYVLHDYAAFVERLQLRRRNREAPGYQKHAAVAQNKLDDFLRFESYSEESEQESSHHAADEAQETALRDIHLEDSRENPNTMYGMIYGISETWLRLLSQTTRLANQMDAIKATEDTAIPSSLLRKAAQIEDIVCSLASSPSVSTGNALPNMHLHKALNSALVIFFYRRIRNVNPWILQSHVDDIIRALASFDQALTQQRFDGPGLVWPAFMAACEAITTTKRNRLMHWIECASAKTGIHYYRQAKEVIEEVWKYRDALSVRSNESNRYDRAKATTQSPMSTWMDVLREKKIWLMAC